MCEKIIFHVQIDRVILKKCSTILVVIEQPDGALLRTPGSIASNGGAVRVSSHVQISDTSSDLFSEGKSKKGRVAPALYVSDKKWKAIWRYCTSNTAQVDPEDRKYDQY